MHRRAFITGLLATAAAAPIARAVLAQPAVLRFVPSVSNTGPVTLAAANGLTIGDIVRCQKWLRDNDTPPLFFDGVEYRVIATTPSKRTVSRETS